MTLTFVPAGWLLTRYRIVDAGGTDVGAVEIAAVRTRATLTLGGAAYDVRTDALDGATVLTGPDGVPVAQAARPSFAARAFDVDWGDGRGRLRPRSPWPFAALVLEDDAGTRVAVAEPHGWRWARLRVGTAEDWPLERAAFVGTLALFQLRQQRRRLRSG